MKTENEIKLKAKAKADYLNGQTASGLKIGDKVKVLYKVPSKYLGWSNGWNSAMDKCVGKTYTIHRLSATGVHMEETLFGFPFYVLDKVNEYHEIGERWIAHKREYILGRCGRASVTLIDVADGNCWKYAVEVTNIHRITDKEWKMLTTSGKWVKADAE